jgi:hypothetical protein
MRRVLGIAAIAALCCGAPALGDETPLFQTGDEVLSTCASRENAEIVKCYAFLTGVLRGVSAMVWLGNPWPGICLPRNATETQMRELIVSQLQSFTPQLRHQPSGNLVVTILRETYPCATPPASR